MTSLRNKFLLTLTAILLSSCSAHPGSGNWVASDQAARFSRIAVEYDGKAELFVPDRDNYLYRCFWSGHDATSIRLQCSSADNEQDSPEYVLNVGQDGMAELSHQGDSLGRYTRQQP